MTRYTDILVKHLPWWTRWRYRIAAWRDLRQLGRLYRRPEK